MTLDGTFREWSLDPGSFPNRIVTGPGRGRLVHRALRREARPPDDGGTLTEYPIDGGPVGITVGRDRQLYVDLDFGQAVARVNLHGVVTGDVGPSGRRRAAPDRDRHRPRPVGDGRLRERRSSASR